MANTAPPSSFYVSDSLSWTASYADYPASVYATKIVFGRPGQNGRLAIDSEASGDDHAYSATSGVTSKLEPGRYTWAVRATKSDGSTSEIIDTGATDVLPDPTAETVEETHAARCLRLVEAALEGRIADPVEASDVLGINISRTPVGELMDLRNRYQILVNRERQKAHARTTGRRPRTGRIFPQ